MIKKSVLILIIAGMVALVMPTSSIAGDLGDFLKNENSDNPLSVSIYVAKTFNPEKLPAPVRVKLERESPADNFENGNYKVSVGLEF